MAYILAAVHAHEVVKQRGPTSTRLLGCATHCQPSTSAWQSTQHTCPATPRMHLVIPETAAKSGTPVSAPTLQQPQGDGVQPWGKALLGHEGIALHSKCYQHVPPRCLLTLLAPQLALLVLSPCG
jgi:hypothetical protein